MHSIQSATFSKVRVAYNNVYRKVLDVYDPSSESEMFATNIIWNFEALIRMSIFALIACLSISSNTITHSEILDCRRHNLGKIDGEIVFASLHPLLVIPNFNAYWFVSIMCYTCFYIIYIHKMLICFNYGICAEIKYLVYLLYLVYLSILTISNKNTR